MRLYKTEKYGGPQLSWQKQKPHGKTKTLTAKANTSQQLTKYLTAKANNHSKTKAILFLL